MDWIKIHIDANLILSVYGKEKWTSFSEKNQAKILYIDKKRANNLFRLNGSQWPDFLNVLADKSILQQVEGNVNKNERLSLSKDSEGNELTTDNDTRYSYSKETVAKQIAEYLNQRHIVKLMQKRPSILY